MIWLGAERVVRWPDGVGHAWLGSGAGSWHHAWDGPLAYTTTCASDFYLTNPSIPNTQQGSGRQDLLGTSQQQARLLYCLALL